MTCLQFLLVGSCGNRTESGGNLSLIEEHTDLVYLALIICAISHLVGSIIETTDNLIFRCLATHLIVTDTETDHVDAHIRWRLVGVLTIDTLEECIQHRENLDVTIVVDSCLVISLEVEGVDHVHIVQVCCSSLVGDVYRVLQRQVPHREGLELGITSADTTLVLVVEL